MDAGESGKRPEMETFLAPFEAPIRELACRLVELAVQSVPGAQAHVYPGWKSISIDTGAGRESAFCGVYPTQTFVSLFFVDGVRLVDPQRLLQGGGKQMRAYKVKPGAYIPENDLQDLLRAAAQPGGRAKFGEEGYV
jgi:hypothetical protein